MITSLFFLLFMSTDTLWRIINLATTLYAMVKLFLKDLCRAVDVIGSHSNTLLIVCFTI